MTLSYDLAHLVFRKSEGLPTSGSSVDLAELASLPLVIKEKDVEYQVFNPNKLNGLSHSYQLGESIFSSPVQSTGRAIVLTLASAFALALPLPFPSRHF